MKTSKLYGNPPFAEMPSIRPELLAQTRQPQKQLSIETLLKIQKVSDYLERKGRSKNTTDGFVKHIRQIAQRANLNNPTGVEMAIARVSC